MYYIRINNNKKAQVLPPAMTSVPLWQVQLTDQQAHNNLFNLPAVLSLISALLVSHAVCTASTVSPISWLQLSPLWEWFPTYALLTQRALSTHF